MPKKAKYQLQPMGEKKTKPKGKKEPKAQMPDDVATCSGSVSNFYFDEIERRTFRKDKQLLSLVVRESEVYVQLNNVRMFYIGDGNYKRAVEQYSHIKNQLNNPENNEQQTRS